MRRKFTNAAATMQRRPEQSGEFTGFGLFSGYPHLGTFVAKKNQVANACNKLVTLYFCTRGIARIISCLMTRFRGFPRPSIPRIDC